MDVPWGMGNANSGKLEGPEIRDKMEIVTLVFSLDIQDDTMP